MDLPASQRFIDISSITLVNGVTFIASVAGGTVPLVAAASGNRPRSSGIAVANVSNVMFQLTFVDAIAGYPHYPGCCRTALERILSTGRQGGTAVLRLDLQTSLEAYGDVLYGTHLEKSLTEDLLRCGLVRIVRPIPYRAHRLIACETLAPPQSPSAVLTLRDRSIKYRRPLRAIVVEIVSGGWVRCLILSDAEHHESEDLSGRTMLIALDGIVCDEPSSAVGYEAIRCSQRYLFHATVWLLVRSWIPSDKDQSNNTQESTWEQIEHLVATLIVETDTAANHQMGTTTDAVFWDAVSSVAGGAANAETLQLAQQRHSHVAAIATKDSLHRQISRTVGGDWARVLVKLRLAKMRQVHSNACRSANFHALLQDAESVYRVDPMTTCAPSSAEQQREEALPSHKSLSSPTTAAVADRCPTPVVVAPTPTSLPSSSSGGSSTPLASHAAHEYALTQFWAASLSDSCVSSTMERSPKTHHYNIPMQCMLPKDRWLFATSVTPCDGVVHGVDLVKVEPSSLSSGVSCTMFARLSLLMSVPGSMVLDDKEYIRSHQRGSVTLFPPPVDINSVVEYPKYTDSGPLVDAAACYSKRLRVKVTFDPELSDIPSSSCDVYYYVANCSMASLQPAGDGANYDKGNKRGPRIAVKPPAGQSAIGPMNASEDVSIDLALPGGTQHCAFVIWVQLKHDGKMLHSSRAVYALHAEGTLGNDLCVDTDEAEFVAGNTNDDIDAAGGGGGGYTKQALNSGNPSNPTPSSRWKRSETYHALIDVYLPMSADAALPLTTTVSGHNHHQQQQGAWLLQWAHDLMYKNVSVRFLSRCIVNGYHGYLAHVNGSDDSVDVVNAFVESVTSAEFRDKQAILVSTITSNADEQRLENTAVSTLLPVKPEVYGASKALVPADGASPRLLFPKTIGDPTIPLASFAVAPVQLFASHPKHHRNIIPETAKAAAKGNAHINAAFMRLRFDRLPNVFRTNLDRLPPQLRDEYVKESLPQDVSFVGHEKPLAALLAALFTLHPRRLGDDASAHGCSAFVHNSKLNLSSFRSTGVLFSRHQNEADAQQRGAAGGNGSLASKVLLFTSKKSYCEVLTDPTSLVVFPSLSLPQRVAADIVAAVASDVATQQQRVDSNEWSLAKLLPDASLDRPMGMGGLSSHALKTTESWLYRPLGSHHGIAVVGGQLLHKKQQCRASTDPSTSSSLNLEVVPPCYGLEEDEAEVMFQYVTMRTGGGTKSATSLYRLSSYGQLSRDLIFKHQYAQFRTGRFLVDYFTLLLRRRQRNSHKQTVNGMHNEPSGVASQQFPNGVFKSFGNAHEPLYLLYMGRRFLRNLASISFQWDSLSIAEKQQRTDETVEAAGDGSEVKMFETLLRLAERLLREIHLACGSSTAFLNIETTFSNESATGGAAQQQQQQQAKDVVSHALCTIKAYCVEDLDHMQREPQNQASPEDNNEGGMEGEEDGEREAEEAEQRTFEMVGNVYGRLPKVQVKVWWVGGEEMCLYELINLR
ncbi:Hypothetical protein, putative [Bodo saltans]|uniref:TbRIF5 SNase domain-containing protein n=1 Tax=Bodo saltans TaxID=75058 RepID=A0A0S4JPT9_BODSA|nr:Hypothetical protein, putative [Bodo saltans]|eukprot:CUG92186.1 Hypothetical protein, putative [Bodo saltans]